MFVKMIVTLAKEHIFPPVSTKTRPYLSHQESKDINEDLA